MDLHNISHESLYISGVPLINSLIERLGLRDVLEEAAPADPRADLPYSTCALALIRNFTIARQPLYGLQEWLSRFVPELFDILPEQIDSLNDDRIARCLDRLYEADRETLLTRLMTTAVCEFGLSLDQLHNDSTTITFAGQYASSGSSSKWKGTKHITYGHNKDHRPDLKQLVLSLSLTADGNIPIHYCLLDGNTTDDSTHIATWRALRQLRGRPDFIYVADSKLCTIDNLAFINRCGGYFVTVMPRTRAEDRAFKDWLQKRDVTLEEALRRSDPRHPQSNMHVYRYVTHPFSSVEGFRIIWIHSSAKHELDQSRRDNALQHAIDSLNHLLPRLGKRNLKTRQQIEKKIQQILEVTGTQNWLKPTLEEITAVTYKQIKPGRPGKDTAYKEVRTPVFRLYWSLDRDALLYEAASDGYFPLMTNLEQHSAADVLRIYKQQPCLEKRHQQLKSVLDLTPINLKTPKRIEAFVLLYFITLLLHSLLERQVRNEMEAEGIDALQVYPESRACERPTAAMILSRFEPLRRHRLLEAETEKAVFYDQLTDTQRQVLELLGVSRASWGA